MSWIDDIQNKVFEIVTGDGKTYSPKWLNAVKEQDYNTTVYDFVGVEGSFVDRKSPRGRKFTLEFYFDGDNAIDLGNNFEISARDKRKWLVKHPFYGNIYCQPISLKQDNSKYNVSKFQIPVIETIGEGYPDFNPEFVDIIADTQEVINEAQIANYAQVDSIERNSLQKLADKLDGVFTDIINDEEEFNIFKQKVDNFTNDLNNVLTSATRIGTALLDLINYPATITQSVEARFNGLVEVLESVWENLSFIDPDSRTVSEKVDSEIQAGGIVTALCYASTTNIEDSYNTRAEVIAHQDKLINYYESYLAMLDENQTNRNDTEDSYSPDYDTANDIANIIGTTISNLYIIAFDAKQEREYISDRDSNAILLCHKFYGMDADDEKLDLFIETNEIGLSEILNIKKGRKILYYI